MLPSNPIAFKEWAVICAALAAGRQTIILRKGGIHEGREGFRVAHDEFWLFPTYLHERADGLVDEARPLLESAAAAHPPEGTLRFAQYAIVSDVVEVRDESPLARLAGQHLWSSQTVTERFRYRQPGLFVLIVRMHALTRPLAVADSPHFAGCRSWVELSVSLSTSGATVVIPDEEFARRRTAVFEALGDLTR